MSYTELDLKSSITKLEVQFISAVRIDLLHYLFWGNECLHRAPFQCRQTFVLLTSAM